MTTLSLALYGSVGLTFHLVVRSEEGQRRVRPPSDMWVVSVKLCNWAVRVGGLSCLPELLLALFPQQVHVEIAGALDPSLVRFGAKRAHQAQAAGRVREDANHPRAPSDLLVQPLQHVGALQVLVMLARRAVEGERAAELSRRARPRIAPESEWLERSGRSRLHALFDAQMRVASTPGAGSTFSFSVSLALADVAAADESLRAAPSCPEPD
jgi:hypothetical protein